MKKATKTLSNILTYIFAILLVLAAVGAVAMLINVLTATSGMYVVYAENEYNEDNAADGLSIEWQGGSYEAVFTVCNTEGWGLYSVENCTVKIIPNYTDSTNFDFTADDKNYIYSNVTDLSAAFIEDYTSYDGNGIAVDEDGNFTLCFDIYYTSKCIDTAMDTVLSRVYGEEAETSSSIDISSCPYFALEVTSPDGETVLTIPFTVCGDSDVYVYNITYNLTNCYVNDAAPAAIKSNETVAIYIYSSEGYYIYSIRVYNADVLSKTYIYNSDGTNVCTLIIDNPTSDVIISPFVVKVKDADSSGGGSGDSGGGSSGSGGSSSSGDSSGSDSSTEDSSTEDSSAEDSGKEDEEGEETDAAITYNLTGVTAKSSLPSAISEITDDTLTLSFAVDDGYHISDCTFDSSVGTIYVTSDGGCLVGMVYVSDNGYSYEVADDIVNITISTADLVSGFTVDVTAEKTHYIYFDLSGCNLCSYYSITYYASSSVSEDQLIPSDYYSRGDLYVEYYSGYGLVEINFHSENGYSFLVTYDEDSEVYTDNYEFSYTYTGDVSNVSLSSSGSGTTEVSSKYCYLTLRDAYGSTDWNITIHLTCYEDVSE